MILLLLLLLLFAGSFEGIMDTLQFHYYNSIFIKFNNQSFWNPEVSWGNKWKAGDPLNGPAFWGSSSAFVSLTDAWHLFKLFRNVFLFVGISSIAYNADTIFHLFIYVVIARSVYGLGFWITYNKICKK